MYKRQALESTLISHGLPYPENINVAKESIKAIENSLLKISREKTIKVVILSANGPVFSAGHDLKEMRANTNYKFIHELFLQCSRTMLQITRLPQPVIAKVNGIATAAGCQLVASCDLALSSNDATFATPGVNIGLFCSTPMVAVSRKISRKRMMKMLLTGEPVNARTAKEIGLINDFFSKRKLEHCQYLLSIYFIIIVKDNDL